LQTIDLKLKGDKMLNLKLRNHVEEIPKLFRVVERLNDKFDSFELYHHSTSRQISELEYIANGREESFKIYFFNEVVWGFGMEDYYEEEFVIGTEDEVFNQCCERIFQRKNFREEVFSQMEKQR